MRLVIQITTAGSSSRIWPLSAVKEEHSGVPTEGLGLLYGALELELASDITG